MLGVGSVEESWGIGEARPFNCVGHKFIADVMYVPQASAERFGFVVNQIHRGHMGRDVWQENTVGTIMHIMEHESQRDGGSCNKTFTVPSLFSWYGPGEPMDRSMIARCLDASASAFQTKYSDKVVFHPVKISMILESATVRSFVERFTTEQLDPAAERAKAARMA
jgi:hypothetical protein